MSDHDFHERVLPFTAGDGMELNLINVRGSRPPTKAPVLLVHGAGVRAGIFRAPVATTIVDALVSEGYDVWLENWRASIDIPYNDWTLDQAARYDHPAAVQAVVADTGQDRIKAIIHCQGSTSFAMSAAAGLVPEVTTIVSNAVSFHPVVPWWSRLKARYATPVVGRAVRYLDPGAGDRPESVQARVLTLGVKAVHHECRNTVCKLVSFTYGSGFPALWRHENLNGPTHDRFLGEEFGKVPVSFFRQIARCIARGHLVAYQDTPGLPDDYVAQPVETDARFSLFAGGRNECFLPESQARSHRWLDGQRRGVHTLHVLDGYSHLDLFLGTRAAVDVFPLMLAELDR
jgi:hypothetical protein